MLLFAGATGCSSSLHVDLCTMVNEETLLCVPSLRSEEPYEVRTREALGYACLSPGDFGEVKKRARQILEGLEGVSALSLEAEGEK